MLLIKWKMFANWNRSRLNYNSKMPSFIHMSRSYTLLKSNLYYSHIHTKSRNFCDMNCSNVSELYEFIMWNVCVRVSVVCDNRTRMTVQMKWKTRNKKVAFTHTQSFPKWNFPHRSFSLYLYTAAGLMSVSVWRCLPRIKESLVRATSEKNFSHSLSIISISSIFLVIVVIIVTLFSSSTE